MMRITLYFDEDAMDNDLAQALRTRGVDVVRAHEVELIRTPDEKHLEYATTNGRVLYSFNVGDYMALHTVYLEQGREHAGMILGRQQQFSVGEQMRRLLRLVQMKSAEQMRSTVEFLSTWG